MDHGDPRALLPPDEMSLPGPPSHLRTSFGVMGVLGVLLSIGLFLLDIVTDCFLAYAIWQEAEEAASEGGPPAWVRYSAGDPTNWFIITVCIIAVPMVIINITSLVWYWQSKVCLGDYCVLHKMSTVQVVIRVVLHLLLLGPLIRYIDILRYGVKMRREMRQVEMGQRGRAILRRSPKGEVYSILQMVISRDTAMLDMIHSFLQDAPQLIFQIFLLYHSPDVLTGSEALTTKTKAIQAWKIALGIFSISWSLVSYQDQLRRTVAEKEPLDCCATTTCLFWRACMVASRLLAIGSFMAIDKSTESRAVYYLFRVSMREDGTVVVPFPLITLCILLAHWLVMTAWIHAQDTTFCSTDDGRRQRVQELLYNCIMGVVHIFSYVNVKDTPSRRRMVFFYGLCLVENTAMMTIWYIETSTTAKAQVWFMVMMVSLVEALWVVGICCIVGYYSFLHPDKDNLGASRNQASWRR